MVIMRLGWLLLLAASAEGRREVSRRIGTGKAELTAAKEVEHEDEVQENSFEEGREGKEDQEGKTGKERKGRKDRRAARLQSEWLQPR